ncbi:hypothetical protein K2173_007060 [Erythroxylum novogranatense]|uniref:Amino acid transporter transmembrane domain-containing protein n=1 Tax=Erythroxylum novogranatense TaxID=1862640 RepID=A0AAV8SL23_9ROSI|nr:hypothetical protein K2173_007060 [Erythroxylum novogranatense]
MNSIPMLTYLAPLIIFVNVVNLGAMGVVMTENEMFYLKNRPPLEAFSGFSVFFYSLGVVVYAFEGIDMMLPLQYEAKHKAKFGKVSTLYMTFIALLYGRFRVLGYFASGDNTKDVIGLCVNLFFTFPLMMNPVDEVIEMRCCGSRYFLWLRWVAVLRVSLIALLVPNFADFLALVGSSGVCITCFRGFILDSAIIAFGSIVAVSGTWISLLEILATKSS